METFAGVTWYLSGRVAIMAKKIKRFMIALYHILETLSSGKFWYSYTPHPPQKNSTRTPPRGKPPPQPRAIEMKACFQLQADPKNKPTRQRRSQHGCCFALRQPPLPGIRPWLWCPKTPPGTVSIPKRCLWLRRMPQETIFWVPPI